MIRPLVPNAGMLPNVTYVSCYICHGDRRTSYGLCTTCADPDVARVRWMLERLTAKQIDFLRAFSHTLAMQPVTETEHSAHLCDLFVEDCDGVFDEDDDLWIVPNSSYWFAGAMHHSGPAGNNTFIHYNPAGLLLRECLMAGATAGIPHMYPPHAASVDTHPKDGDGEAAPLVSGAVPKADAQEDAVK